MPQLRRIGQALVLASLVMIGVATLLPEPGHPLPSLCIICGTVGGVDAVLNVLLFVPLGVGLALSSVPRKRALLGMAALSLMIETTQLFAIPGRDASIGDFIMNTIGGVVGFSLVRHLRLWTQPSPRVALRLSFAWAVLWLAIQTASSFAFAPALPRSHYYGQIARRLEIFATFEGKVLAATIGHTTVPNYEFPNSTRAYELLKHHSPIAAVIVPVEPTPDLAPIVRVADDDKREIVILAEDVQTLVFGLRSGAALARLRPPLFALRGVFPDTATVRSYIANDTLALEARYGGDRVELRARGRFLRAARDLPVRASLGWTLLAPSQWYIDGRAVELLFTWIWVLSLLIPQGYWASRTADGSQLRRFSASAAWWSSGALALFALGFVLIPTSFGLSPASLGDWLAGFVGVASGYVLGWRVGRSGQL